jgi:hypothetical protein
MHETNTIVENNVIEDNLEVGLMIKEPSRPKMKDNCIKKNLLQVKMDSHYKREWPFIERENINIEGNSEIPGNGCILF